MSIKPHLLSTIKLLLCMTVASWGANIFFTKMLGYSLSEVESRTLTLVAITCVLVVFRRTLMQTYDHIVILGTGAPARERVGPFSRQQVFWFWWIVSTTTCIVFL